MELPFNGTGIKTTLRKEKLTRPGSAFQTDTSASSKKTALENRGKSLPLPIGSRSAPPTPPSTESSGSSLDTASGGTLSAGLSNMLQGLRLYDSCANTLDKHGVSMACLSQCLRADSWSTTFFKHILQRKVPPMTEYARKQIQTVAALKQSLSNGVGRLEAIVNKVGSKLAV